MIFQVVRLIPKGRVSSYGAIANYIGAKGAARVVGYAMNSSHMVIPSVPAHRVVNRNGLLSGKMHFENETKMQELLELEGIEISKDQIHDFKVKFWDPTIELSI